MRVVKLGGSLADWERLPQCLASLLPLGVTIVPGGGPFAEQVRAMHGRWRFEDGIAHTMAILAMCQFGLMLTGLESRLSVGRSCSELRQHASAGLTAVWLPQPESLESSKIPASWAVTSDSLAAWLAARLGATDLILLKSVKCQPGEATLQQLAAAGVVDRAFGEFAAGAPFSTWLCHREDYTALAGFPPQGRHGSPLLRVSRRQQAGG